MAPSKPPTKNPPLPRQITKPPYREPADPFASKPMNLGDIDPDLVILADPSFAHDKFQTDPGSPPAAGADEMADPAEWYFRVNLKGIAAALATAVAVLLPAATAWLSLRSTANAAFDKASANGVEVDTIKKEQKVAHEAIQKDLNVFFSDLAVVKTNVSNESTKIGDLKKDLKDQMATDKAEILAELRALRRGVTKGQGQ